MIIFFQMLFPSLCFERNVTLSTIIWNVGPICMWELNMPSWSYVLAVAFVANLWLQRPLDLWLILDFKGPWICGWSLIAKALGSVVDTWLQRPLDLWLIFDCKGHWICGWSLIAKTFGSASIRHFTWDWRPLEDAQRVFAIWDCVGALTGKALIVRTNVIFKDCFELLKKMGMFSPIIRWHLQNSQQDVTKSRHFIYWHGLILMPPLISNSSVIKWDEITYPFANFSGATVVTN